MIHLKEQFKGHDEQAKAALKETFEFTNATAPIIINDVNYWLFGDLPDNIPDDYCDEDPTSMMNFQLEKMKRHYETFTDDAYVGFLHPWYGTGVLASGFGIPIAFHEKADPGVGLSTVKVVEDLKNITPPDPEKDGLMPQVLKTIEYFKTNCDLQIGFTDCQGPLTTSVNVIGYDKFFYWMYDYPKKIHALMEMVTDALIAWVKLQKELSGMPMETGSYPLGVRLPEGFGGAWMSDDDCVLLPANLYKEFVVPYNSKFLKAFGGGCIHYCGTATQHIENFLATDGLTAINCLSLDDLEAAAKMKAALSTKGIVYMACDFAPSDERLSEYYQELFASMDPQGLIVVPYIAPAIELDKGKYEARQRNPLELAKKVRTTIEQAMAA